MGTFPRKKQYPGHLTGKIKQGKKKRYVINLHLKILVLRHLTVTEHTLKKGNNQSVKPI